MASNLVRKGFPLTVFDVNPTPVRQLEELGATAAADCDAVAGASDHGVTMLPNATCCLVPAACLHACARAAP